jgi:hypothetical protein
MAMPASAELRTTKRPDAHLRLHVNIQVEQEKPRNDKAGAVIPIAKRQSEYHQGYRAGTQDRIVTASSMSILVGAAMIAAAILLSTLISALGSRYVGLEGPSEESAWLIDRLTGEVYRCQASERGRAACDAEMATGTIVEHPKP